MVPPVRERTLATAPGPSITRATTGPPVMKATSQALTIRPMASGSSVPRSAATSRPRPRYSAMVLPPADASHSVVPG